jgi:transcriptional regulator GlxA family with amidase domain
VSQPDDHEAAAFMINRVPSTPLTSQDHLSAAAVLARQAGVSVRALQKAFREQLESSPIEYLRDVRLQRVHDELSAAQSDGTTVREIAAKWGLLHHGRFSAIYRERFGESPRQTLGRQHFGRARRVG